MEFTKFGDSVMVSWIDEEKIDEDDDDEDGVVGAYMPDAFDTPDLQRGFITALKELIALPAEESTHYMSEQWFPESEWAERAQRRREEENEEEFASDDTEE
ncbi:expressed unknown protein [Seminavis robusta]|uniref:Uncharacterized protein n=1 Tax=Seminavis robusta TaxID=568900 RepID=A0A9N8HF64_9STRA|nr:expressed unknown protein [Seminavis robusta]|eukprot:Sro509_g157040.1 n/a (101) ;mRNA; r:29306-29608